MKKILWLTLFLSLTACFDPLPVPAPRLHSSTMIPSGTSEFLIEGQYLFPEKVQIAGQDAQILAINPNGTSVKVKLTSPLKTGTYSLKVDNSNLSATAKAGITVLETGDVFKETDYNNESTHNQYILDGGGLLAFKPDASNRSAVLAAIAAANFSVTQTQEPLVPGSTSVCGQTITLLKDDSPGRSVIDGLNELQRRLGQLEPGIIFDLNAKYVANSPSAGLSQALGNPTKTVQLQNQPRAIPNDLHLARVAVIDSGVKQNHPVFGIGGTGNLIDVAAARNFTTEGTVTDVDDLAGERDPKGTLVNALNNVGHGTAVTGMVGATILQTFAPAATSYAAEMDKLIVPIKACEGSAGRCRNSSVILGVCYAISLNTGATPVKIINLSLGGKYPSSMLLSALQDASERDMTIVTSAGNNGTDLSKPPNYPANYSLPSSGSYDAIPGLISVASVEPDPSLPGSFKPSDFSSVAQSVTISGIGVVQGVAANQLIAGIGALRIFSGTSFSAPQVSAAASLYYAKYVGTDIDPITPNLQLPTPQSFKQKLIATAIPPGTAPLQNCTPEKCGAGLLNIAGILTP